MTFYKQYNNCYMIMKLFLWLLGLRPFIVSVNTQYDITLKIVQYIFHETIQT